MLPESRILNLYGSSEIAADICFYEIGTDIPDYIPIGTPIYNNFVYVLDENSKICPPGVAGELYVSGLNLAVGYYNSESENLLRFIPNPYNTFIDCAAADHSKLFRTGDMVVYSEHEHIYYLGRKDKQVKINGCRIEIAEIEHTILSTGEIEELSVMPLWNDTDCRLIVFFSVKDQNNKDILITIRQKLLDTLPVYMHPTEYYLLDSLPLLTNGKINKNALLNILTEAKQKPKTKLNDTLSSLGIRLVEIWTLILNMNQPLNTLSNFFEIGGSSLDAIRLINKINSMFNQKLRVSWVFSHQTLQAQEEFLKNYPLFEKMDKIVKFNNPTEMFEIFPVTDIQNAYLIGRTNYFAFGGITAHVYFEIKFKKLNIEILSQALNELLSRHLMLRAVVSANGQQRVLNELPKYQIKIKQLASLDRLSRYQEFLEYRQVMQRQNLASDTWPLLECSVCLLEDDVSIVSFYVNLLISDGKSSLILINDLFYIYNRLKNGLKNDLPPLNVTYRDYQLYCMSLEQSSDYQKAKDYWLSRLHDFPQAPQLPTIPKNRVKHPGFEHLSICIKKSKWEKFKKIALSHTLSPSSALCSIFVQILKFWSKEPRFMITVMYSDRLPIHVDINSIIGNFSSTILLALNFTNTKNFAENAKALYHQLLSDMDNSIFSGVKVLHELNKIRGDVTNPTSPIVFNSLLGGGVNKLDKNFPPEIKPAIDYFYMETPQVELDHQVFEDHEGNLVCNWDFVKNCFPEKMVETMFNVYVNLLEQLADDHSFWLKVMSARDLISTKHFSIIHKVNDTKRQLTNGLLHTDFIKVAKNNPHQIAVLSSTKILSYKEIYENAVSVAKQISLYQAGKKSTVAIIMEKGWEQYVAAYGILFSGFSYLPIDPKNPPERIKYMLDNAEIQLIITQNKLIHHLNFITNRKFICISEETIEAFDPTFIVDQSLNLDDLAYIIYTSGSTGEPKGVMISHRGAKNTIEDVNKRFLVSSSDKIFAISAFTFDLSVYDAFGALSVGATLIIPDSKHEKDPAHWADMLKKYQVTIWNSAPSLMQMLIKHVGQRSYLIPQSLRLVLLSGDLIPVSLPQILKQHVNKVEMVSLGGATEASIWSILHIIQEEDSYRLSIPYGKPMFNQQFYIFDQGLDLRPIWAIGELYISGVGLAKGYLNDSKKTESRFIQHPITGERLYKTGDLGYYEPDGNIIFIGRADQQVKIKGHRVELQEIENALRQNSKIAETIVIYQKKNQLLVAYISYKDEILPEHELAKYLAYILPDYMIPSRFIILKSFPLNGNGKIDRKLLPEPEIFLSNKAFRLSHNTELEKQIIEIWKKHLNLSEIGINENFFALGGDSFKAVMVMSDIYELCGKEIGISTLLTREGNIESLAKHIEEDKIKVKMNYLIKINDAKQGSPLFFIHPIGGSALCYRNLATKFESTNPFYGLHLLNSDINSPVRASTIEEIASLYLMEIQQTNSNEDYYLGGWSMGGIIAYEMASQLKRQGKKVKWVAMIDSPLPIRMELKDHDLLSWFFTDILRNLINSSNDLTESTKILAALVPQNTIADIIKKLWKAKLLPKEFTIEKTEELFKIFKTNYEMLNNYHPIDQSLKLIQIKATKVGNVNYVNHPFVDSPCWGWSSMPEIYIDTYTVDGDHYSIISETEKIFAILKHYMQSNSTFNQAKLDFIK